MSTEAPQLRVYLTGGLRIETTDAVIDHRNFDFPSAQLVFAYLVSVRGRPVAITELAEILPGDGASPNTDPREVLSRLRSTLAEHVPGSTVDLSATTATLSMPADTWVDVEAAADAIHEAESALRNNRPAAAFGPSAVAHHIAKRPFLPGERGSWIDDNRERLRDILLRALQARGEVFLWNSEHTLAIEAARGVLKLEPFHETGHRLLIRALAAAGNTAEALRAYERCRQMLRERFGIEPSAQTRRVLEILAPQPAERTETNLPPPTPAAIRTPDLRSAIERSLGAEYTVERELTGGMSRVFVAQQHALGRRVVIKLMQPLSDDSAVAQRFAREIQLAARLQHPNIVPVLATGLIDGIVPYYTMPYVAGESLRSAMAAGDRLSVARVISILRDVARALAFAHGEGVIHRDIKPENILLAGDVAVVTDFGIAKALNDTGLLTSCATNQGLTSTGVAVGTPQYMAPEQVFAPASADHRADIFSLGVVAYELLSGALPFGADRLSALMMPAAAPPKDVRLLRPETPMSLASLVMRCLNNDVDARPQRMKDVAAELDAELGRHLNTGHI